MGKVGIKWDFMKKNVNVEKTKRYIDLHLRLPLEVGKIFVEDSKKQRRKYAEQMTIILEHHYQPKDQ